MFSDATIKAKFQGIKFRIHMNKYESIQDKIADDEQNFALNLPFPDKFNSQNNESQNEDIDSMEVGDDELETMEEGSEQGSEDNLDENSENESESIEEPDTIEEILPTSSKGKFKSFNAYEAELAKYLKK